MAVCPCPGSCCGSLQLSPPSTDCEVVPTERSGEHFTVHTHKPVPPIPPRYRTLLCHLFVRLPVLPSARRSTLLLLLVHFRGSHECPDDLQNHCQTLPASPAEFLTTCPLRILVQAAPSPARARWAELDGAWVPVPALSLTAVWNHLASLGSGMKGVRLYVRGDEHYQ